MSAATPPELVISAGRPAANGADADRAAGAVLRLFHLTTLAGLAVAAPLLDLLARHAEFLVAHRLGPSGIVGLVAMLLLLPALPLAAIEWVAARLSDRLAGGVHLVFVGALVALVCLPIAVRSGLGGVAALAGAALVGSSCAWAYGRRPTVRLLVSFLGIVLIGVPGSFFLQPKIRGLFQPRVEIADSPRVVSDTPIVMVIFDEFAMWPLVDGEGAINRHRFPNLAALADRSIWFANAETVAHSTERAVPALVTGRMPMFEQLPSVSDYPQSLFTLFARSHRIWSVEPITFLCPNEINRWHAETAHTKSAASAILADLGVVYLHTVLPPPFRSSLPPIDMGWRDFGQKASGPIQGWREFQRNTRAVLSDFAGRMELVQTFLELLERDAESGQPSLQFLHVLLPHRPLQMLPTGQSYSPDGSVDLLKEVRNKLTSSIQGHLQAQQRYYLQLGYVDHLVGEMVRRLEASGRFDESLIVLAADHGISYRADRHERSLTEDADPAAVLPVPLLIKKPFQNGGEVVEHRVRTIDVLPTILDILGVEPPWDLDGRSAFDDAPRGPLLIETRDQVLEFGDEIHQQKLERAREMIASFGTGEDPLDLFRVGPYAQLVGKGTRYRIQRSGSDRWTVSVVGPERYQQVEAGNPVLPVLVQGTLQVDEDAVGDTPCCDLAIAVDGVVQTTFSTASEPGAHGRVFSALLPPSSLTPGAHRFEMFSIVPIGHRLRLERLQIVAAE